MNTETMDTKVEEAKAETAPQLPMIIIVFPNPKQPMIFSTQLLNGATEQQLLWAAHWIYHSLMTKLKRDWTRELNKQESVTDRLRKFGGKFKRKNQN